MESEKNINRSSDFEEKKAALLARISASRKSTKELEKKIQEESELKDLEKKARKAELRARDLPHIRDAEIEHGVIGVVKTDEDGAIVLRKPNHLAFDRFSSRMSVTQKKPLGSADYWKMIRPCIVYPEASKVDDLTEKYPALMLTLINKVIELGNAGIEEAEGK